MVPALDICPDGVFTKGMRSTKNERLVMHETIGQMSSRISQLEAAIESMQALVSTQPHPLLQGREEQVMHPIVSTQVRKSPSTPEEDVIKALGAFFIGNKGETTFHEASATSEASFARISPNTPNLFFFRDKSCFQKPHHPALISTALSPFPPETINTVLEDFLPHVPPFPRAQFLARSYFENGAWSVDPVHQADFMHRVLTECYPDHEPSLSRISADLVDPPEAEDFYVLARAALCVRPVYDYPTVYAIQSMVHIFLSTLMMWFQTLAGHRTYAYRPLLWGVLNTACELMNLNRDPRTLNIEGIEAEVRQVAFWEAKSLDQWQAFASGRPAAISSLIEDCKQPYEEAYLNPDAQEADHRVWLGWKQHFTDVVNTVADQAFRAKDVTYSRILALEKQLRHHPTPVPLRWPSTKGAMYQKLGRARLTGMQCLGRIILQESSLLHLHRWFFMQAVREKPHDPLDHQYSYSVRTVYQSASAILMSLGTMYAYHPVLVSRCKTAWAHAFSAALTMGTLVVSAPTIPLAHPAMIEFERACTLFQNTGQSSVQPDNAARILMDLLQAAKRARDQGYSLTTTPESVVIDENNSGSSQSPVSVGSQQSWNSTSSSSGLSQIPVTNPGSHHNRGIYASADHYQKTEYEPAAVRENLRQWWDSAAQEQ
ncbi:hypothetical protein JB92DRAFT_3124774 [Gautieria morchelliformis]|nr:hypothetical protein JB92DRAFT_3124774 [Gautieria morchelliformis]